MRLRHALVLAASLAAPALPAAAQIREGLYGVTGLNPDGSQYEAQFSLQPAPGASWLGTWMLPDGSRVPGLGLIQSGVLSIAFIIDGRPGIAAYEVGPDGTLRGSWSTGGGIGTETLMPK